MSIWNYFTNFIRLSNTPSRLMKFDHFTIRLLRMDDLDSYFDLVRRNKDRLADRFVGTVSRTQTLEEAQEFVEEMLRHTISNTYYPYVIVDQNDESIIGFVDLKNIDWTIPKTQIGFYIDESYAGQGIISKAVEEICKHCFEEKGFEKLYMRIHEENIAALKVADKCGFDLEGTIRKDYRTHSGELVDLLYYGRLK